MVWIKSSSIFWVYCSYKFRTNEKVQQDALLSNSKIYIFIFRCLQGKEKTGRGDKKKHFYKRKNRKVNLEMPLFR